MNSIDRAINNIETGMLTGVLELALDTNISIAKLMVEEWARNVSDALQHYTDLYLPKEDDTNPLFYETGTMFEALTYIVDINPQSAIKMYLDVDDGVEPRTGATIMETFGRINYGVTSDYVNIPARPVFYDVLGALNQQKIIMLGWKNLDKNAFERGFRKGLDKVSGPMTYETRFKLAQSLVARKPVQLKAKYLNYYTGQLRWF